MDVGLDLGPASLVVRQDPVEAVGEQVGAVGTEDDNRRKDLAVGQGLHIVVDDVVVDRRAGLGPSIGNATVEGENLPCNTGRQLRRKPGRGNGWNSRHETKA